MEKDPNLNRIVKEHGLVNAPADFTNNVLSKVRDSRLAPYKPLIGTRAKIMILAFVILMLVVAILGTPADTGDQLFRIPEWKLHIPEINLKIPSAVLAGIIAVLVLVLTDARISRSRLS